MRTVSLGDEPAAGQVWDPILIRLAELHTMQSFAATRLELAAERARGLLGSGPVAALEIAELLRTAAGAAGRSSTLAEELRRDFSRLIA